MGMVGVHGFRCYDNMAPNAKCQRVLVLAVCLIIIVTVIMITHKGGAVES